METSSEVPPLEHAGATSASPSGLWSLDETDCRVFNVPDFEYQPLDHDRNEQRFVVLHPCSGDKNDEANYVKCDIESSPLSEAEPFIAIKNARGYRLLEEGIAINGQGLLISSALERFLRNFRRPDQPVRLWTRYLCLVQADPEERTRYWTRDFNDMMYALATEVVDMSECNQNLRDRGVIERTYDSRHGGASKEWYSLPEETVLPKVYPIRLGKKPSNRDPVDDYEYLPLDLVADEIRVLVLVPSREAASPIVCHLGHCPIVSNIAYAALSYRWGDDTTAAEIVLNGQKKSIRKSLEQTLRAIRLPEQTVPIWIDAISINQGDLAERNRQVSRMGEIYNRAAAVINYVGPESDDSDLALELIKELKMPMMRFNDEGEWHFGEWGSKDDGPGLWYGENRIKPDRLARMCAALYKFYTRPYFRRAWVLQELAFASNPTVGVGNKFELTFQQLDMAAYHMQDILRSDPTLAGQMMNADPTLIHLGEGIDVAQLTFIRKLFYFRHLACRGEHTSTFPIRANIRETAPSYLETLILARDFECTDLRDKVYALWNLVRDKAGLDFAINYSEPVHEVYTTFTKAWINQHGSLDILATVEAASESAAFYQVAPSWCPDWSRPAQSGCLVRRERIPTMMTAFIDDQEGVLYSADGGMTRDDLASPLFNFEDSALHVTAIVLDQTAHIFPVPPEIDANARFPSCDPASYHAFQYWRSEIAAYYAAGHAPDLYDSDPLRAAHAMFHGDVPSAWPPRAENPEYASDRHPEEEYVCDPKLARHVRPYGGDYNRTETWDIVKSVTRGRRPFVTENGYMGLMPEYAANRGDEKWKLAIVAGCSVPLVLQEREEGSYRVCGTCFVQGWMEAEVLGSMMGAETPRQFWEAVADGEKIALS